MLSTQTEARILDLQQRLVERGVVDVKFFKQYPDYALLTANQRANELCEVIEAMLDGRYTKAEPLGDSVRGLRGEVESTSPITLSPVARCGGGRLGDHNEEEQKGSTASP